MPRAPPPSYSAAVGRHSADYDQASRPRFESQQGGAAPNGGSNFNSLPGRFDSSTLGGGRRAVANEVAMADMAGRLQSIDGVKVRGGFIVDRPP